MKYLGVPQSGSVAAQTFAHNRGQYVRARAGRGGAGDSVFAGLPALWQGLTDDQRQQWIEWGQTHVVLDRLGRESKLSGFGWFCAQNRTAAAFTGGPGFYSVPFVPAEPPQWAMYSLMGASFVTGQLHVQLSGPPSCQGGGMVDVCGPTGYISSGTMAPPGRGAYWSDLFGVVPVVGDNSTGTSFFLRFGSPVSGNRVAVGWRALRLDQRWSARQIVIITVP